MASYGEGQKHHGNDEYGNPVQHTTGGTKGEHGMHGHGTGATTGEHGVAQKLHRSGSSSSSSSEDDGIGGRRKKGIKEKIKEKLPGGHKQEQQTHTTPVTGGSYGTATGEEKKGMMDKIKDKLPGGQQH